MFEVNFGAFFHSFLIAQVFGLYLVILAVIMLGQAKYYRALIATMEEKSISMFSSTLVWLLIGLFLILIHNLWVLEPRVLVTLLGWIIVVKSVFWLAAPKSMMRFSKKVCAGSGYYISAIITGIFGVLLMTKGFHPVL